MGKLFHILAATLCLVFVLLTSGAGLAQAKKEKEINLLRDVCGNNRACCEQKCRQRWGQNPKNYNQCLGIYKCAEKR